MTLASKKKRSLLSALALVATVCASTSSFAADETTKTSPYSGYIGILGGVNIPSNSNSNTVPTFGATLGAKLAPQFGVGLFGSYYAQTSSGSFFGLPTGTNASTTNITGQLNFFAEGLHIGGEAGLGMSSWSGSISTARVGTNTNYFVYGPEAGYDFRMGFFSIGAEAHYLIANTDSAANNLQLLAALKIWID